MTLAFTRRMAPETPYLMAAVLSGRRRPRQRPGAKDWLKIAHRLAAGLPPRAAALPEGGDEALVQLAPRARGVPGHGRGLAGRPRRIARGPPQAPDRPRPPGAGAGAALRRRAGRRVRARGGGPRPRPGRDPRRGRAQGQGPRPAPAGRAAAQAPPLPLPLGPAAQHDAPRHRAAAPRHRCRGRHPPRRHPGRGRAAPHHRRGSNARPGAAAGCRAPHCRLTPWAVRLRGHRRIGRVRPGTAGRRARQAQAP